MLLGEEYDASVISDFDRDPRFWKLLRVRVVASPSSSGKYLSDFVLIMHEQRERNKI